MKLSGKNKVKLNPKHVTEVYTVEANDDMWDLFASRYEQLLSEKLITYQVYIIMATTVNCFDDALCTCLPVHMSPACQCV